MGVVVESFLVCDECGETYGVDTRQWPGKIHRAHARGEGWHYSRGKDYCPECWAAKQGAEDGR